MNSLKGVLDVQGLTLGGGGGCELKFFCLFFLPVFFFLGVFFTFFFFLKNRLKGVFG